jgi:hypothetical protein
MVEAVVKMAHALSLRGGAGMQWSQLKHRVEARFAPSLRGRVQVWAAVYRKPATTDGRGWITLDGEQIHSMTDTPANAARDALWQAIEVARDAGPGTPESDWTRHGANYFTYQDFREALECSLQSGVDELLGSPLPLCRALAMLDGRLGKRRFQCLAAMEREHPLVRLLYGLRARAERWPVCAPAEEPAS